MADVVIHIDASSCQLGESLLLICYVCGTSEGLILVGNGRMKVGRTVQ